jgi:ribosomal protein L16 Arg81 hydroxylase
MPDTLAALIAPISPEEFRTSIYTRQHVHIPGTPDKFAGLFSASRLEDLLNAIPIPSTAVLVVLEGRTFSVRDSSDLKNRITRGATVIVQDINQYDDSIREMNARLSAELGEPVRINMYFSQAGKRGYNTHYDTHDVFVAQIIGKKRWRLFDKPLEDPLFVQKYHPTEPPINVLCDCVLKPGDLLYIPRGHWHDATAEDVPSVHLTIGIRSRTGVDFVSWLADELRDSPEWRAGFPLEFQDEMSSNGDPPAKLRSHLAKLQQALATKLADSTLANQYWRYCISAERDPRTIKLALDESLRPPFADGQRFSRPQYQRAILESHNGATKLFVWGKVLTFRGEAQRLLHFIYETASFTRGEAIRAAGGLSNSTVDNVLATLLTEGIISPPTKSLSPFATTQRR